MSGKTCVKVNLIAAVDSNMGIGRNNTLPWRLPKEMNYFNEKAAKTRDPTKKNVVILGRATWESIPTKYRSLKDRINIILSRTLQESPAEGVHVCRSYDEALDLVSKPPISEIVETVWNIGGSVVYREGLDSDSFHRLYLTRIFQEFECDVFFPAVDWTKLKEIRLPDVAQEEQEEKGIKYRFCVYERVTEDSVGE